MLTILSSRGQRTVRPKTILHDPLGSNQIHTSLEDRLK